MAGGFEKRTLTDSPSHRGYRVVLSYDLVEEADLGKKVAVVALKDKIVIVDADRAGEILGDAVSPD